ncbi:PadR family transcriptional regulator [Actibacterium mucosum KCTC 23349]|uniref:PadR family transcriptional regulator n=1 Tax=Actibacterium mucosum KCTC 23349 TaxID=1454373 RepID=A0A037ZJZ9_9RHOB|nr:helix-turn-helix domain-containing GNAT family N-acetyltransferase [Actibacterium mucosum]KAJ56398.1 PadR family transcriptional regulator [Actibacterium mucosum KCTC 23349]
MSLDPIARIRRFNRAVTAQTGALDHSFLGRGRPLGLARTLHAISHFGQDVATIRAALDLDKAVLSRNLKALQAEGLVELAADPADARRKQARLTPAGLAEVAAYDALSDDQAQTLLNRHPRPDALLAAMDLVASALTVDRVDIVAHDPRGDLARHCLSEYYAELARRFDQGFDVTLSRDPDAAAMTHPHGTFLIALSDGLPLGCVGLKGGTDYAEIKRLWVAPAARRLGLSRRLMDAAEAAARTLGITLLRLDTNSALPEAVALYQTTGWTRINRYNDDPYPDVFFEKQLK